jgi:hypothetical protein
MVIDLDPVTPFFFRKNFAVSFTAASTGAVQHFFGAYRLITEKTTGIKGAVTTHLTAIQHSFGNVFKQPQKGIPEFSGTAEMAETARQFE